MFELGESNTKQKTHSHTRKQNSVIKFSCEEIAHQIKNQQTKENRKIYIRIINYLYYY